MGRNIAAKYTWLTFNFEDFMHRYFLHKIDIGLVQKGSCYILDFLCGFERSWTRQYIRATFQKHFRRNKTQSSQEAIHKKESSKEERKKKLHWPQQFITKGSKGICKGGPRKT